MPLFHCNFFAHSLGSPCNVQVFLPTFSDPSAEGFHALYPHRDHRVLYLLHGMNGDDTVWLRKTNVERYAQDHGLALVMPAVQNSFYTDAPLGGAYFRFLTEELPAMLHASFPLSKKREDTFLVGYSMGGYGALKAALTYPERYAAVASFSGALVIEAIAKKAEEMGALPLFQSVFGDPSALHGGKHDLLHLAARAFREKGHSENLSFLRHRGRALSVDESVFLQTTHGAWRAVFVSGGTRRTQLGFLGITDPGLRPPLDKSMKIY